MSKQVANKLEARLRRVFKPDDGGDIIDWLQKNVKQIPFSPMPSGFQVAETPWLMEPLRAAVDPEVRLQVNIAPIQSGKSLMGELLSCYIIARQPSPTLYLNDTNDNATDWMQNRLRILWQNVPPVMAKLPKAEKESKSSVVQTDEMTFWCLGAFNEKNLQRRSIRWLVADETWLYPKGHLAEASARVTSFGWLGKRIFMSQGSFQGDETEEVWLTTDQRVWSFACPECGHRQAWSFDSLRVPDDAFRADGDYDYNLVRTGTVYECEGCKHRFKDTKGNRDEMNARGFYAVTNPLAAKENVGFTWEAVCARSWGSIAEMQLRAKVIHDSAGDANPLRIFLQKQRAKFWSDAPDGFDTVQAIGEYKQGDVWGEEALIDPKTKRTHQDKTLEGQIKCRFMTVDVQRNGFYCLVRSWGTQMESRLFRWKFVSTWEDVVAMAKVNGVHPALVYVDCGDQFDDVIRQCGINKWTALRGDARNDFVWRLQTSKGIKAVSKTYAPARVVNAGTGNVRVHHFSNLALKDQMSRLRRNGKHTTPHDCGQDYLDQMESEVRAMSATGKPEWRRIGKRANHLWDCEVMQLVPALAFGLLNVKPTQVAENTEAPAENAEKPPEVEKS
jgi:phage terminase large subunit GpA-like protein